MEMVVARKNKREGEGQRGTTKEEDHVILLWYTLLVPGSDVLLTRHTLQLASLQDPEEWVYPTVPIAHTVSYIYRMLYHVRALNCSLS